MRKYAKNSRSSRHYSHRIVICLILLLGLNFHSVDAAVLNSSQTYFDPDSLSFGIYARDHLYPNFDGVNVTGNSIQWSGGITDVDILPMLKPYSVADPTGYPIGYSFTVNDYYYEPVIDYIVDLTAGIATATFSKEGIYHARLTRSDGSTEIRAVLANAGTLGDALGTAPSVPIPGPIADLVLVSQPTGGDATLDIANANAVDDNGAAKVNRARSVADAVAKIKAAYQNNGNKRIHLEVVAHGSAGFFQLGDTAIGQRGTISIKDFQKLIDPYVKEISVYACNFAADGGVGLQTLADSLGRATGFDKFVSVHRSWFGFSRGWDLELRGKKGLSLAVPEPSTILLVLLGTLGIFVAKARKTVSVST